MINAFIYFRLPNTEVKPIQAVLPQIPKKGEELYIREFETTSGEIRKHSLFKVLDITWMTSIKGKELTLDVANIYIGRS